MRAALGKEFPGANHAIDRRLLHQNKTRPLYNDNNPHHYEPPLERKKRRFNLQKVKKFTWESYPFSRISLD